MFNHGKIQLAEFHNDTCWLCLAQISSTHADALRFWLCFFQCGIESRVQTRLWFYGYGMQTRWQGAINLHDYCEHLGVVTGGNLDLLEHPAFNWVYIMIGNVKNSLREKCHTLDAKRPARHIADYCFRFNHHVDLKIMPVELGHSVVASPRYHSDLFTMAEDYG